MRASAAGMSGPVVDGPIAWVLLGALGFRSGSWQNELYRAGTLSVSTHEYPL